MIDRAHFTNLDTPGEVYCTVTLSWVSTIPSDDTGPGYPTCPECGDILFDEVSVPAHHVLIEVDWFCLGHDVNFHLVPTACPNCGESIVADEFTTFGLPISDVVTEPVDDDGGDYNPVEG